MSRFKVGMALSMVVLLPACGVNKDNFSERFANKLCAFFAECQAPYFNEYYGSQDECVDSYMDYYAYTDYYQGCEFNKSKAKDCLSSLDRAADSCRYQDFDYYACYEVYDCSSRGRDSG